MLAAPLKVEGVGLGEGVEDEDVVTTPVPVAADVVALPAGKGAEVTETTGPGARGMDVVELVEVGGVEIGVVEVVEVVGVLLVVELVDVELVEVELVDVELEEELEVEDAPAVTAGALAPEPEQGYVTR